MRAPGDHCFWHPGGRPVPVPWRPPRPRRSRRAGPWQEVLLLGWPDVAAAALVARGWPRAATATFAAACGTAWSRAAGTWQAGRCRRLAALARRLRDAGARAGEPVSTAAAGLLHTDSRSRPERTLARAVAERIAVPGPAGIRTAANAVRAAGVCLCLGQGRDLRDCACGQDLCEDVGPEAIVDVLWNALRPLGGGGAAGTG